VETDNPWKPSGTLPSGIYLVQHGMQLNGHDGVAGNVLIYVTGGSVDLHGNGNVVLNALNSPYWEGSTNPPPPTLPEPVLWISSADTGASITLGGDSNATTINGAVYAPSGSVSIIGGGHGGGVNVTGLEAGSVSCTGGGDHADLVAGAPLTSGTFDQPASPTIGSGHSGTDKITIYGKGSLAPTGTVSVYACGPTATSCDSTGTIVNLNAALSGGGNGTSAATVSYTPPSPGGWCFAAYYNPSTSPPSYNGSSDTSSDGCFTVTPPPLAPVITYPFESQCYNSTGAGGACPSPVNWTGPITGTATDPSGPGLAAIQVAIQDPHGKWWQGTCGSTMKTWSSNSPAWNVASGSTTWNCGFTATNFKNNDTGTYTLKATATDTSGSTGPATTVTFLWGG
jgi:hypothetical protein